MLLHDRFVFIHLQKTAGTFLADALRREMPAGSLVRGAKGKMHPGWNDIPSEARGLPVLGYVRNPWDWYVSWYHFVLGRRPDNAVFHVLFDGGRNDFAATVRNACAGLVEQDASAEIVHPDGGDDFYTSRIRNFYGDGLQSELLTIGRFESLVDDLDAFLADAGAPLGDEASARIRAGEPLKVTEHQPYREYYDPKLRDLVAESCGTLVERFDYRF